MCDIEVSYSVFYIESCLLKSNVKRGSYKAHVRGSCKERHRKFCHITGCEQNS